MRIHTRLVSTLAALVLLASPLAVAAGAAQAAPAALTAADAAPFLGAWALGLDTPQGSMIMNLTLKSDAGKISGVISADMLPDPQTITDIKKAGTNLVLAYAMDVQGQSIPVQITIVPDGAKWKASFDFAGGQFVVDGTADKK
jgi:hypothetical protein